MHCLEALVLHKTAYGFFGIWERDLTSTVATWALIWLQPDGSLKFQEHLLSVIDEGIAMLQPMLASRVRFLASSTLQPLVGRHKVLRLVPSTGDSWNLDVQTSHQRLLQKLEIICQRLKKHLDKQEWPRPTHLEVGNVSLKLPVSREQLGASSVQIPKVNIAYLAGFFDGDGCVGSETRMSGCRLEVAQQVFGSAILVAFLDAFGGSICLTCPGKGNAKPAVKWIACGETARFAAAALHAHCLVKREQLGIAINWPQEAAQRRELALRLKLLKQAPPNIVVPTSISWNYFTGFFDAEGCIRVAAKGKSVRLEVAQRDGNILHAVRHFLLDELPPGSHVPIYSFIAGQNHARLTVLSLSVVVQMLREMVANGLLLKRPTALHVLHSLHLPHSVMRDEPAIKGNQNCFSKLDAEGCIRAQNINRLRSRLRLASSNQSPNVCELDSQLSGAILEHSILNLLHQVKRLRSAIASLRLKAEEGMPTWHSVVTLQGIGLWTPCGPWFHWNQFCMSGWHNPLGLSGVEKGGRIVRWELNCCVCNQGTGKSGKVHRHNHQRKDLQEAVRT